MAPCYWNCDWNTASSVVGINVSGWVWGMGVGYGCVVSRGMLMCIHMSVCVFLFVCLC